MNAKIIAFPAPPKPEITTRTGARGASYTPEFVAAHLWAGRPLLTLGLSPQDHVVVQARAVLVTWRLVARVEVTKGDPLVLL